MKLQILGAEVAKYFDKMESFIGKWAFLEFQRNRQQNFDLYHYFWTNFDKKQQLFLILKKLKKFRSLGISAYLLER